MIQENNFEPIIPRDGEAVYGVMNVNAVRGNFVQLKNNSAAANSAGNELELVADGNKGFYLTRDVVDDSDSVRLAHFVHQDQSFTNPFIKGQSQCTGQSLGGGVFEGTDILDASITSLLTAGTKIKFLAGKIAAAGADPAAGELVRQLTPLNGGSCRVEIHFY